MLSKMYSFSVSWLIFVPFFLFSNTEEIALLIRGQFVSQSLMWAFELGTNLVTIPYAGNYCVEYGIFSVYIAIEIQTKFDLKKQKS